MGVGTYIRMDGGKSIHCLKRITKEEVHKYNPYVIEVMIYFLKKSTDIKWCYVRLFEKARRNLQCMRYNQS